MRFTLPAGAVLIGLMLLSCTGRREMATEPVAHTDSIAAEDSTPRPEIIYIVLSNTNYPKDVQTVPLTMVNNTQRTVYTGLDFFIER